MRLIDADYALKILTEDWFLEIILTTWGKSDAKEEIENALNRVETAYDLEEVVAELEAREKSYRTASKKKSMEFPQKMYYTGIMRGYEYSREVVQNGGKE